MNARQTRALEGSYAHRRRFFAASLFYNRVRRPDYLERTVADALGAVSRFFAQLGFVPFREIHVYARSMRYRRDEPRSFYVRRPGASPAILLNLHNKRRLDPDGRSWWDELERMAVHELAHAFLDQVVDFRPLLGWMDEGFARFVEAELAGAATPWRPSTVARLVRAAGPGPVLEFFRVFTRYLARCEREARARIAAGDDLAEVRSGLHSRVEVRARLAIRRHFRPDAARAWPEPGPTRILLFEHWDLGFLGRCGVTALVEPTTPWPTVVEVRRVRGSPREFVRAAARRGERLQRAGALALRLAHYRGRPESMPEELLASAFDACAAASRSEPSTAPVRLHPELLLVDPAGARLVLLGAADDGYLVMARAQGSSQTTRLERSVVSLGVRRVQAPAAAARAWDREWVRFG